MVCACETGDAGGAVGKARGAAAPRAITGLAALFRLPGLGRGAVVLAACLGCHDPASAAAAGAVLRPLVSGEDASLWGAGVAALAQVAAGRNWRAVAGRPASPDPGPAARRQQ